MGNRCGSRTTYLVSRLVLAMLLFACSACGFNPPVYDFSLSGGSNQQLNPQLELTARLRHQSDDRLIVDYVLHNKSHTDFIALTDNSQSLQAALQADGSVRLFLGKKSSDNVGLNTKSTVVGQMLSAGANLNGSAGLSSLPLTFAFAQNPGNSNNQAEKFEFCVGYGLAHELLPERLENEFLRVARTAVRDEYRFDSNLVQQRFVCTKLPVQSQPSFAKASALDADHWESALKGVISVLNNQNKHVLRKYASLLTVPDNAEYGNVDVVTFIQEDGSVGTRSLVSCAGGGHYDVTESFASTEKAALNFNNCVNDSAFLIGDAGGLKEIVGKESINGVVERSTRINESGETVTSLKLKNFRVANGSHSMHIFSGLYEYDDGNRLSRDVMIDMNVEMVNNGQSTKLNNLESTDTSIFGTAYERGLAANFSVSAPWTLDQPLTVTIPVELAGKPIGGSSNVNGLLVLETAQGDRLTLDMTNAHENKVLIALDSGGEVTFEHREWAALFDQF